MAIDVPLPELGEGVDSADVLEVLVAEGDRLEKDQGIVEIETDKATVTVPTPHAGVVRKVHVQRGQAIRPGAILITIDPVSSPKEAPAGSPPKEEPVATSSHTGVPISSKTAPVSEPAAGVAPPPKVGRPVSEPVAEPPAAAHRPTSAKVPEPAGAPLTSGLPPVQPSSAPTLPPVPAGPAIRRFAREVGVDLRRVKGTGPGGRITREDVLEVVRAASQALGAKAATASDAWGPIRVERLSKIRRTIAEKMHASWTTVPRVTNFDDADVTELERIRQASKADYASKGIKLTALPFVIKAVAMALRAHPQLNASLDLEHDQVIFKEYVHIGVAVDSERGLVVPVLRDADQKSIPEIARCLAQLAEKVRNNDYTVDDLRGGTFTVSNLGAIGGTYSTPIVNVPEVAILLVGRSRKMPVVVDDQIAIRLMMPLSLSYDHRLVDGAAAARFLNDVIGYLETPSRLLLAP
ncbi:MAG: dihydrolipoamide acetyltransferase component of pyruvate dehydrogenase complex [Pirellulaceae bacterium]|nr:MAG: dihydrolipoamide acetyltransferase component of pyruvate dehydrogenase complex [Pirellulaceae bacterium]GIW95446.1 MAG: dihydrolipoamide acetyltransferase component of pyruvate dehydrogenase complex [Pirellulaceae bacterium]GIW96631.1 MAG: dihydrolipoamide acetyltransferase component of pyruvate dehydrogenase complex [Pirellulaceae bacterium]